MALDEICDLPVAELATKQAILFLWTTNAHLANAMKVIEAWGFTYVANLVWVKDKIGMGYWVRNQHELLLIATKGKFPSAAAKHRVSSVLHAPRTAHSEKPKQIYEIIERMYPTLPKIELFARNSRHGWDNWGNEVQAPPKMGYRLDHQAYGSAQLAIRIGRS